MNEQQTFEEFSEEMHRDLEKAPEYFWAKKSDKVAHISKPDYTVWCRKYGAMLGNNYAYDHKELCPECLKKAYEAKISSL